ncbi:MULTISPECIES: VOC family protein [unclassified Streptomyces]|uniref:VOC family protein n=1 Tax=unclassified Streptomyces TaxID=2593676 RepID=UPI0004BFB270|nr:MULTISPECIES: VOC family protein [unclassified Streptomyces]
MTSRLIEVVVDCHDPERLATFWSAVLGWEVIDRDGDTVEIGSWDPTREEFRARQMPPTLIFIPVPEGKTGKNRLHLDVSPVEGTTEDEVTRLLALGAKRAEDQTEGAGWVVMTDPEDNEFCVLRTLDR